MASRARSSFHPLTLVGGLLVASIAFGLVRGRAPADEPPACDAVEEPGCGGGVTAEALQSDARGPAAEQAGRAPPTLAAATGCNDVGYLCAELATADRVHVRRWRDTSGTLVVHIPRPDFEDPSDALALQQAASLGIRAWNGQPFQIRVDLQGDGDPDFSVRWVRTLSGNQIGLARTQWSSATGLSVLSIDLVTRHPLDLQRLADPRQVRLTAAHEMGHALGLPHSDAPRDVMYPTNTATALSPRDYRTMESLYALPDGTEIVRQ